MNDGNTVRISIRLTKTIQFPVKLIIIPVGLLASRMIDFIIKTERRARYFTLHYRCTPHQRGEKC